MSAEASPVAAAWVIPADLDVAGAPDVAGQLAAALGADPTSLALDVETSAPTQVALQLLFATLKEARLRGIGIDLGEHARTLSARVAGRIEG